MRNANLHGYTAAVNCYDTTNRFIDILVFCDDKDVEKVVRAFDDGLNDFYEDDTICWGDAVVYHLNLNDVDCYIDYATLTEDEMEPDDEWDTLVGNVAAAVKAFRGHCYGD